MSAIIDEIIDSLKKGQAIQVIFIVRDLKINIGWGNFHKFSLFTIQ